MSFLGLFKSVDDKINEIIKFASHDGESRTKFIQILKSMHDKDPNGFDKAYKSFTKLPDYEQSALFRAHPLDYEKTINDVMNYDQNMKKQKGFWSNLLASMSDFFSNLYDYIFQYARYEQWRIWEITKSMELKDDGQRIKYNNLDKPYNKSSRSRVYFSTKEKDPIAAFNAKPSWQNFIFLNPEDRTVERFKLIPRSDRALCFKFLPEQYRNPETFKLVSAAVRSFCFKHLNKSDQLNPEVFALVPSLERLNIFSNLSREERTFELFKRLPIFAREDAFKLLRPEDRTFENLKSLGFISLSSNFQYLRPEDRTFENLKSLGLYLYQPSKNFRYLRLEDRTFENLKSLGYNSYNFKYLRPEDRTLENFESLGLVQYQQVENFQHLRPEDRTLKNLISLDLGRNGRADNFQHLRPEDRTFENLKLLGVVYYNFKYLRPEDRTLENLKSLKLGEDNFVNNIQYLSSEEEKVEAVGLLPDKYRDRAEIKPYADKYKLQQQAKSKTNTNQRDSFLGKAYKSKLVSEAMSKGMQTDNKQNKAIDTKTKDGETSI